MLGEELLYSRTGENLPIEKIDLCVTVSKDSTMVWHVPRKILLTCLFFLRQSVAMLQEVASIPMSYHAQED